MNATKDRIYQASDLAGTARKSFIADALRDQARLRSTDGESLVMLREARLDHVAAIADYAAAYLTLEVAMRRPRSDRRRAEYGPWAFIAEFEDDDIDEFRQEVNDAIVTAISGDDRDAVERVLEAWRMSARTLADPVARSILSGDADETDWVEVEAEQG